MAIKTRTEVRGGDIQKALKNFKRKTLASGHLRDLWERKEYTKPTTIRRKLKKDAIRREKYRVWQEKNDK